MPLSKPYIFGSQTISQYLYGISCVSLLNGVQGALLEGSLNKDTSPSAPSRSLPFRSFNGGVFFHSRPVAMTGPVSCSQHLGVCLPWGHLIGVFEAKAFCLGIAFLTGTLCITQSSLWRGWTSVSFPSGPTPAVFSSRSTRPIFWSPTQWWLGRFRSLYLGFVCVRVCFCEWASRLLVIPTRILHGVSRMWCHYLNRIYLARKQYHSNQYRIICVSLLNGDQGTLLEGSLNKDAFPQRTF